MTFGTARADWRHLPLAQGDRQSGGTPMGRVCRGIFTMYRLLFTALCATAVTVHAAETAPLSVTITDVRNADGHLFVAVESTEAGWNFKAESVAQTKLPASKGRVTHVFEGLAPGKYAVMVIHDENENGKLDSNFMGIPSEGYGFSQNPRVMRRATFEEALFELPAGGTDVQIKLR
jgi:uncharacterized protein (DUF2141 family)